MAYKEYQRGRFDTKHYHKGDIVYWIRIESGKRVVRWGVVDDEFIDGIRNWLLRLEDFEDYEFRGVSGGFQYKKWKNKKWFTVGVSVI